MKRALTYIMGSACVLGALSVRANLVLDPGFEGGETGTLTLATSPWLDLNNNGEIQINTSNPNTGSYNAVLTATGGGSPISANLAQTIALTVGPSYTVSFWIAAPASSGTLAVYLNGVTTGNISIPGDSVYTQYTYTLTPGNSSGFLSFVWSTTSEVPTSIDLDDVSVTPVPEPTTMIAGALMLLPFAASTVRLRKKTSA